MGAYLKFNTLLRAAPMLAVMAFVALAADPGIPIPPASEVNDQKPGSVLFYSYFTSNSSSYFTSSSSSSASQDTRISITNINPSNNVAVHLFFVEGTTCSMMDNFICLTKNQTKSFLASDLDPGVTGYLVAIAVDGTTGCPVSFNFLLGDASVRLSSGHRAEFSAEAIAALYTGVLSGCGLTLATLNFDGVSYNQIPRALALDKIGSAVDQNSTLLVVNRVGGNLTAGASPLGPVFGILYGDTRDPHSFTLDPQTCQLVGILSNDFIRTTPPFQTVIPAGLTGWMKLWAADDVGIFGVAINFNENAAYNRSAFSGGDNLHKLTLSTANSLIIPVIPPTCW